MMTTDREVTREQGIAHLMRDGNLRVPCSRYGSDTKECAPVAYAVADIIARETGEALTTADLEHAMGLVVNDHSDPESILREHGGQHGYGPDTLPYWPARDFSLDVVAQYEGASMRTADELAALFIHEAGALTYRHNGEPMNPYELIHDERVPEYILAAVLDYEQNGWCEDADNSAALADFVHEVAEGWLDDAGYEVWWNDGVVVYDAREWTEYDWDVFDDAHY